MSVISPTDGGHDRWVVSNPVAGEYLDSARGVTTIVSAPTDSLIPSGSTGACRAVTSAA